MPWRTNVWSTQALIEAVGPIWPAGWGRIVTVSSAGGPPVQSDVHPTYAAAKRV